MQKKGEGIFARGKEKVTLTHYRKAIENILGTRTSSALNKNP